MGRIGNREVSMTKLEEIEDLCAACGIEIERAALPAKVDALYFSASGTKPVIAVDYKLRKHSEQVGAIAEELGHHYTTVGNLLTDARKAKATIRKQEQLARRWAFQYAVSFSGIIDAWDAGARSLHDMAEHLGIEGAFLLEALETYENVYGSFVITGETMITFRPVSVLR
jgi:hypothetical protein